MAINNSAARLHNILTLCRQADLGSKQMLQAWRKVLGFPDSLEEILVVGKIGKVFALPSRITSEISQIDDIDHRLFLGWKPDLSKAFQSVRFDTAFNHFSTKLSDSLLINIEFCAHELSKRRPEKIVEPQQLADLKEQADKLYQAIVAAKLDSQTSYYLVDHTIMIIDAIDDYVISGAAGLETSISAVIGSIATQRDIAAKSKTIKVGEQFWGAIEHIALVLNLAQTSLQLGESIGNFIEK